ncbi:MAG: glycosyltransferase family 39 protein, partial [Deltaproteobacteria bacterium]|nr:glycosyltransferase family 39 protein [Deltaproteobacteria bacterium]
MIRVQRKSVIQQPLSIELRKPAPLPKGNLQKTIAFGFATLLAAALAIGLYRWQGLKGLFVHSVYYFLWASLAGFCWVLWDVTTEKQFSIRNKFLSLRLPLAIALSLVTLSFLTTDIGLRVLADEANLLSTSLSLYLDQSLRIITEGLYVYDTFYPIGYADAGRPALFPFVVHIFHCLFGFNGFHSFAVNFVCAVLSLAAIILFGRKIWDLRSGIFACALLVSFPLFAIVCTSGGYEVINILFFCLFFFQLYRFLENPSALQLELLFYVLLFACHCRYETPLLVIPFALAALNHSKSVLRTPIRWRIVAIPFLFLPIAWQRITVGFAGLITLEGRPKLFNLDYVVENTKLGFQFFFDTHNTGHPISRLAAGLSILGAIWIIVDFWIKRR